MALPTLDRHTEGRGLACPSFEDAGDGPVVGPGELDHERAHLRVLGPCGMRDVGRPQDGLARGDPRPLLPDADPAAALDHDEPGRVGIGVRLDGRVARLTSTSSEFGKEYDSLSDMVSFGLAPAIVTYQWGVERLAEYGALW